MADYDRRTFNSKTVLKDGDTYTTMAGSKSVWRSGTWVPEGQARAPVNLTDKPFDPPQFGDFKWVGGSKFEWRGKALGWLATGQHDPGLTNTPHAGEPLGARIRPRVRASILTDEGVVEVKDNRAFQMRESPASERKATPIYSTVLRYFPDAIAELARLCIKGNDQHNPGTPVFWDRSKSGDELDALTRHLMETGTKDSDGHYHDTKVAWRALANLQKLLERERGLPISPGSKNGPGAA